MSNLYRVDDQPAPPCETHKCGLYEFCAKKNFVCKQFFQYVEGGPISDGPRNPRKDNGWLDCKSPVISWRWSKAGPCRVNQPLARAA